MEGMFYNVNNGYVPYDSYLTRRLELTVIRYLEGIVRGYRNSLLTSSNYNNLTQCETIDGESATC